jgi:hypothetical protein
MTSKYPVGIRPAQGKCSGNVAEVTLRTREREGACGVRPAGERKKPPVGITVSIARRSKMYLRPQAARIVFPTRYGVPHIPVGRKPHYRSPLESASAGPAKNCHS